MVNYKEKTIEFVEEKYNTSKKYKYDFVENLRTDVSDNKLKICLFGSGFLGKGFYNDFMDMGIKISYFCDNDSTKWDKIILEDVKCISPAELKDLYESESVLVVLSLGKVEEVYTQLSQLNIKNIIKHPFDLLAINQNNWRELNCEEIVGKIRQLFDILEDEESKKVAHGLITAMFMENDELNNFSYLDIYSDDIYIPKGIVNLKKGESIVDGGSFTGDTLNHFLNKIKYNEFDNYYCFELNKNNVEELKQNLNQIDEKIRNKVVIYNKAIAENSEVIYYRDSTSSSHVLAEVDGIEGESISLDNILKNKKVTYIKMDIEGSEISALKGAKDILETNKPTCAISIYHKATDVWEIPLLLKKYVPEYGVYLRHHEQIQAESLCYAVKK